MEEVITVDREDRETGRMEKIEAHRRGILHRAFSIFVMQSSGKLLMQKRSNGKYHSPGLWTNTCCSHPRPGEPVGIAALRRLNEEMGIRCELSREFSFIYKFEFDNGLTENEFDHVFTGICDDTPVTDPDEVDEFTYTTLPDLENDMAENPEKFTIWFRIAYPLVSDRLKSLIKKSND